MFFESQIECLFQVAKATNVRLPFQYEWIEIIKNLNNSGDHSNEIAKYIRNFHYT